MAEGSGCKLSYQIEPFAAAIPEIKQHVAAHWEEVASRKDLRTLDPDWDTYLAMDQLGRVTLGTVRQNGALVGYLMMVSRGDLNSRGTQGAESAVYYVAPRPMRGLVQRNLIRFVVAHLRSRGIEYIKFRNKLSADNSPILRNCGFVEDEMLWIFQPP